MKKIIVSAALLIVFTVFISVNSYSQTQEPVKKEQVKQTQCSGHSQDVSKSDTTKVKTGCPNSSKKCPSTCPHAKVAGEKSAEPANSNVKKEVVPQK